MGFVTTLLISLGGCNNLKEISTDKDSYNTIGIENQENCFLIGEETSVSIPDDYTAINAFINNNSNLVLCLEDIDRKRQNEIIYYDMTDYQQLNAYSIDYEWTRNEKIYSNDKHDLIFNDNGII